MSDTNDMRRDFEFWYSDEGQSPNAVMHNGSSYVLMQAVHAWWVWQAAKERATSIERERCAMVSNIRISDNAVAVDTQYFWQPMSTAPRGVKLQLLNEGGVGIYATYNGSDTTWRGWAPLPSKPPSMSK